MRIVCLSDTHLFEPPGGVPVGDVLVHAGDLTMNGGEVEVERALEWISSLPHENKFVIAGNHDFLFENRVPVAKRVVAAHPRITYLQDSGVTVGGRTFWGTPWQPWFGDWAFNLKRGAEIRTKWNLIPANTDVLIVHCPPAGWLDRNTDGEESGCADLLVAIRRIAPRLVVCGHIHEGYGQAELISKRRRIQLVNASICDADYRPVNLPVVIDID